MCLFSCFPQTKDSLTRSRRPKSTGIPISEAGRDSVATPIFLADASLPIRHLGTARPAMQGYVESRGLETGLAWTRQPSDREVWLKSLTSFCKVAGVCAVTYEVPVALGVDATMRILQPISNDNHMRVRYEAFTGSMAR